MNCVTNCVQYNSDVETGHVLVNTIGITFILTTYISCSIGVLMKRNKILCYAHQLKKED